MCTPQFKWQVCTLQFKWQVKWICTLHFKWQAKWMCTLQFKCKLSECVLFTLKWQVKWMCTLRFKWQVRWMCTLHFKWQSESTHKLKLKSANSAFSLNCQHVYGASTSSFELLGATVPFNSNCVTSMTVPWPGKLVPVPRAEGSWGLAADMGQCQLGQGPAGQQCKVLAWLQDPRSRCQHHSHSQLLPCNNLHPQHPHPELACDMLENLKLMG